MHLLGHVAGYFSKSSHKFSMQFELHFRLHQLEELSWDSSSLKQKDSWTMWLFELIVSQFYVTPFTMDSSRADDLVPSELKGAKQFENRHGLWWLVHEIWWRNVFLLTLVRWQEDLAASFVHQMGWNQGNQPQPFSLPRRWWGLARHRRGVAWRLQLGSWDNVVVEKVFCFFGYVLSSGTTRKSKQLWLWLWFFAESLRLVILADMLWITG